MAYTSDSMRMQSCQIRSDEAMSDAKLDRKFNINAVLPPGQVTASLLGLGVTPSSYGAMDVQRVTQDSAITGRMQPLSRCPEGQVRYLPPSLFPLSSPPTPSCVRTDLQADGTRVKKSCQPLAEVDVSIYGVPGPYQMGFQGAPSILGSQIHSKIDTATEPLGYRVGGILKNYGSYTSSRDMGKYKS